MVVELTTSTVRVVLGDVVALSGALWADIKREESTWLIQVASAYTKRLHIARGTCQGLNWCHAQDGLLQLHMLKRNRRGAYADGATNADTFWPAVRPRPESRALQSCCSACPTCCQLKCTMTRRQALLAVQLAEFQAMCRCTTTLCCAQVLKKHASAERLPGEYPPAHYYRSAFELPGDTPSLHSIVRGSRHHRPMIDRSRER